MKRSIFGERLAALRLRLEKTSSDTIWVIQPENRRYLSGFRAGDTQFTESSGSLIINKRCAYLITDSRYSTEAVREAPDFKVITMKGHFVDELAGLVGRIRTKRLGFEQGYLTYELHKQIAGRLRNLKRPVRLSPVKGLVQEMRIIKDRTETAVMGKAAALMSSILDNVISGLKPGCTEKGIAREIEVRVHESGADGLAFTPIVASGPNSALPHAEPTNRRIREKEPVILDVGLRMKGYCCDMTRTVFLGTPGPKFRKIYRTVREAQLAALQHISDGIDSSYSDSIARKIIRDAGFGEYFGHSLGHGVGLAVHEDPALSPRRARRLEKGMVVTVEPGIYLPGKGGVRLEEMVVVCEKLPKILTKNNHYYDF